MVYARGMAALPPMLGIGPVPEMTSALCGTPSSLTNGITTVAPAGTTSVSLPSVKPLKLNGLDERRHSGDQLERHRLGIGIPLEPRRIRRADRRLSLCGDSVGDTCKHQNGNGERAVNHCDSSS